MSYFMRAFCGAGQVPSVTVLVEHLRSKGLAVHVESSSEAADQSCRQVIFRYKPQRSPIVITCNFPDDADGLFGSEIGEFLEKIGPPRLSLKKRRVIGHLRQSKFMLVIQVPGDIDPAGLQIADAVLQYCIDHCEAMVQTDEEGFYVGNKLIFPLQ